MGGTTTKAVPVGALVVEMDRGRVAEGAEDS